MFVVDSALPYFLKRTCSTFDIRVAFSLIEQIPELGVNKDINETITAYSKIDYGIMSLLAKRLLSGNTKPLLGNPAFYEPPIEYQSYWATEGYILNYFIELQEEYIKCLDDLRHLSTKKYYQKNRGELAYHRTDPKGELTPVVAWHYEICETALDQALNNTLVSAWKDGSYNHNVDNVDIVAYLINSLTSFDISIGKALIPRPDIGFPSKSGTGVSITQLVSNDWVRAAHIELEKQIAWNRHNDKGGVWLSSSFIIRPNTNPSSHILSKSLPMVDKIIWLDELEDTPEYEIGAPLFSLLKIGNISFTINTVVLSPVLTKILDLEIKNPFDFKWYNKGGDLVACTNLWIERDPESYHDDRPGLYGSELLISPSLYEQLKKLYGDGIGSYLCSFPLSEN